MIGLAEKINQLALDRALRDSVRLKASLGKFRSHVTIDTSAESLIASYLNHYALIVWALERGYKV